ncbi:hypothetical protein, partial [Flavobacterium psychrophilum]
QVYLSIDYLASSHHKNNQNHCGKQIKNHTLACASAPSHSVSFFIVFVSVINCFTNSLQNSHSR